MDTRSGAVPIRIPFPSGLLETRFVARPNRFVLHCALGPGRRRASTPSRARGGVREVPAGSDPAPPDAVPGWGGESGSESAVAVHLADPGRLKELLLPGRRVWVRPASSPTRKTAWSAVLVESPDGRGLVSVDTTMPNRLIQRALEIGALEEFDGWSLDRSEWRYGRSRIDFLLTRGNRRLALEVKSVTLVEDGVALFPDAITARGTRHVLELAELARRDGWEAAILFVLQRENAHRIEAARSIDPAFADALAEARAAGVRILARRCRVTLKSLELADPIPAS